MYEFTFTGMHGVKQISCGEQHIFIINESGNLYCTGNNRNGQLGLGDNNERYEFTDTGCQDIVKVACGRYHTVIMNYNGVILATEDNDYGQLDIDNINKKLI